MLFPLSVESIVRQLLIAPLLHAKHCSGSEQKTTFWPQNLLNSSGAEGQTVAESSKLRMLDSEKC